MTPKRPLIRFYGGKWRLTPWILQHLPPHRCYVEPFGGGASVLLRKARACELIPFARAEFDDAYNPAEDPLEQARRTVFRSFSGFGSAAVTGQSSGFRANSNRSGTTPAHNWMNYPDCLRMLIQRLRGVVIENRDAIDCMARHDAADTLHYVDPPYVHSTRSFRTRSHSYLHEMTDAQHEALAGALHGQSGVVVLSGYRCELYDRLYADWTRIDGRAWSRCGSRRWRAARGCC